MGNENNDIGLNFGSRGARRSVRGRAESSIPGIRFNQFQNPATRARHSEEIQAQDEQEYRQHQEMQARMEQERRAQEAAVIARQKQELAAQKERDAAIQAQADYEHKDRNIKFELEANKIGRETYEDAAGNKQFVQSEEEWAVDVAKKKAEAEQKARDDEAKAREAAHKARKDEVESENSMLEAQSRIKDIDISQSGFHAPTYSELEESYGYLKPEDLQKSVDGGDPGASKFMVQKEAKAKYDKLILERDELDRQKQKNILSLPRTETEKAEAVKTERERLTAWQKDVAAKESEMTQDFADREKQLQMELTADFKGTPSEITQKRADFKAKMEALASEKANFSSDLEQQKARIQNHLEAMPDSVSEQNRVEEEANQGATSLEGMSASNRAKIDELSQQGEAKRAQLGAQIEKLQAIQPTSKADQSLIQGRLAGLQRELNTSVNAQNAAIKSLVNEQNKEIDLFNEKNKSGQAQVESIRETEKTFTKELKTLAKDLAPEEIEAKAMEMALAKGVSKRAVEEAINHGKYVASRSQMAKELDASPVTKHLAQKVRETDALAEKGELEIEAMEKRVREQLSAAEIEGMPKSQLKEMAKTLYAEIEAKAKSLDDQVKASGESFDAQIKGEEELRKELAIKLQARTMAESANPSEWGEAVRWILGKATGDNTYSKRTPDEHLEELKKYKGGLAEYGRVIGKKYNLPSDVTDVIVRDMEEKMKPWVATTSFDIGLESFSDQNLISGVVGSGFKAIRELYNKGDAARVLPTSGEIQINPEAIDVWDLEKTEADIREVTKGQFKGTPEEFEAQVKSKMEELKAIRKDKAKVVAEELRLTSGAVSGESRLILGAREKVNPLHPEKNKEFVDDPNPKPYQGVRGFYKFEKENKDKYKTDEDMVVAYFEKRGGMQALADKTAAIGRKGAYQLESNAYVIGGLGARIGAEQLKNLGGQDLTKKAERFNQDMLNKTLGDIDGDGIADSELGRRMAGNEAVIGKEGIDPLISELGGEVVEMIPTMGGSLALQAATKPIIKSVVSHMATSAAGRQAIKKMMRFSPLSPHKGFQKPVMRRGFDEFASKLSTGVAGGADLAMSGVEMYGYGASAAFEKAKKMGLNDEEAALYADTNGMVQGLSSMLIQKAFGLTGRQQVYTREGMIKGGAADFLRKNPKAVREMLADFRSENFTKQITDWGKSIGLEFAEGYLDGAKEETINQLSLGGDLDYEQIVNGGWLEAFLGGAMSTAIGGIGEAHEIVGEYRTLGKAIKNVPVRDVLAKAAEFRQTLNQELAGKPDQVAERLNKGVDAGGNLVSQDQITAAQELVGDLGAYGGREVDEKIEQFAAEYESAKTPEQKQAALDAISKTEGARRDIIRAKAVQAAGLKGQMDVALDEAMVALRNAAEMNKGAPEEAEAHLKAQNDAIAVLRARAVVKIATGKAAPGNKTLTEEEEIAIAQPVGPLKVKAVSQSSGGVPIITEAARKEAIAMFPQAADFIAMGEDAARAKFSAESIKAKQESEKAAQSAQATPAEAAQSGDGAAVAQPEATSATPAPSGEVTGTPGNWFVKRDDGTTYDVKAASKPEALREIGKKIGFGRGVQPLSQEERDRVERIPAQAGDQAPSAPNQTRPKSKEDYHSGKYTNVVPAVWDDGSAKDKASTAAIKKAESDAIEQAVAHIPEKRREKARAIARHILALRKKMSKAAFPGGVIFGSYVDTKGVSLGQGMGYANQALRVDLDVLSRAFDNPSDKQILVVMLEELQHQATEEVIGDDNVEATWNNLPDEVKFKVRKLYSINLIKTKPDDQQDKHVMEMSARAGGYEFFRMLTQAKGFGAYYVNRMTEISGLKGAKEAATVIKMALKIAERLRDLVKGLAKSQSDSDQFESEVISDFVGRIQLRVEELSKLSKSLETQATPTTDQSEIYRQAVKAGKDAAYDLGRSGNKPAAATVYKALGEVVRLSNPEAKNNFSLILGTTPEEQATFAAALNSAYESVAGDPAAQQIIAGVMKAAGIKTQQKASQAAQPDPGASAAQAEVSPESEPVVKAAQETLATLNEMTLDPAVETPRELWAELFKDMAQLGLDIYGTLDVGPVGMAADAASAVMSLSDGKYVDAGASLVSMIPLADVVKFPRIIGKLKSIQAKAKRLAAVRRDDRIAEGAKNVAEKAEEIAKSKTKKPSRKKSEPVKHPLIEFVRANGGFRSKNLFATQLMNIVNRRKAGKTLSERDKSLLSQYDGQPLTSEYGSALTGTAVRRSDALMPDQMAKLAYAEGLLTTGDTADDLYAALKTAATAKPQADSDNYYKGKEEQQKDFEQAIKSPKRKRKINVDQLTVGDEILVDGEPLKVKSLHINTENHNEDYFILEDGFRWGTKEIELDDSIGFDVVLKDVGPKIGEVDNLPFLTDADLGEPADKPLKDILEEMPEDGFEDEGQPINVSTPEALKAMAKSLIGVDSNEDAGFLATVITNFINAARKLKPEQRQVAFRRVEKMVEKEGRLKQTDSEAAFKRHAELEAKHNAGTITEAETAEAQALVDEMASASGWDVDAFHGTTHHFDTFTREKANVENDLGLGFYLTNTEDDVTENYAGIGPDLTNRIERRTEQLLNELENQPEYNSAAYKKQMARMKAKATKELAGGKQRVIKAKIRFTNPVILDGNGYGSGTNIELMPDVEQYRDEAIERVKDNNSDVTDENIDDYSYEVEQAMYELRDEDYNATGNLEKIRNVVESFDGTDWGSVSDELAGEESIPAYRLEQILRKSEGIVYATDPNSGDLAVGELIRRVFEELGYDGIIDKNVNSKFGSQAKGKAMVGMNHDTVHFIAFESSQIKSAEPFTGVPLSERFDSTKDSILHQEDDDIIKGFFGISENLIGLINGKADVSTMIHELAHMAQNTLAMSPDHHALWEKLNTAYGIKPGEAWSVKQKEKFARDVETYFRTGKYPPKASDTLKRALNGVAQMMQKLWKALTARGMTEDLDPEVKAVIDELLMLGEVEVTEEKSRIKAAEKARAEAIANPRKDKDTGYVHPEGFDVALPAPPTGMRFFKGTGRGSNAIDEMGMSPAGDVWVKWTTGDQVYSFIGVEESLQRRIRNRQARRIRAIRKRDRILRERLGIDQVKVNEMVTPIDDIKAVKSIDDETTDESGNVITEIDDSIAMWDAIEKKWSRDIEQSGLGDAVTKALTDRGITEDETITAVNSKGRMVTMSLVDYLIELQETISQNTSLGSAVHWTIKNKQKYFDKAQYDLRVEAGRGYEPNPNPEKLPDFKKKFKAAYGLLSDYLKEMNVPASDKAAAEKVLIGSRDTAQSGSKEAIMRITQLDSMVNAGYVLDETGEAFAKTPTVDGGRELKYGYETKLNVTELAYVTWLIARKADKAPLGAAPRETQQGTTGDSTGYDGEDSPSNKAKSPVSPKTSQETQDKGAKGNENKAKDGFEDDDFLQRSPEDFRRGDEEIEEDQNDLFDDEPEERPGDRAFPAVMELNAQAKQVNRKLNRLFEAQEKITDSLEVEAGEIMGVSKNDIDARHIRRLLLEDSLTDDESKELDRFKAISEQASDLVSRAKGMRAEYQKWEADIQKLFDEREEIHDQRDKLRDELQKGKAVQAFKDKVKTVRDVLNFIAKSKHPLAGLASKILANGDSKLFDLEVNWLPEGERSSASYRRYNLELRTSKIETKEPFNIHTAIHEVLHVLTTEYIYTKWGDSAKFSNRKLNQLAKEKNFMGELCRLFIAARKAEPRMTEYTSDPDIAAKNGREKGVEHSVAYGLANLHEFVSMAFENPAFQEFLKGIQDPGQNKTLWDKFKDLIFKKVFGRDINQNSPQDRTLLDSVMTVVEDRFFNPQGVKPKRRDTPAGIRADRTRRKFLKTVAAGAAGIVGGVKINEGVKAREIANRSPEEKRLHAKLETLQQELKKARIADDEAYKRFSDVWGNRVSEDQYSKAYQDQYSEAYRAHEASTKLVKDIRDEIKLTEQELEDERAGGTQKAYAGEESNMPQVMRDSLEAAKAMAAAGKSREEIRAITGWFPGFGKGNDKLRYEFPDDNMKWAKEFDWSSIPFRPFESAWSDAAARTGGEVVLEDIIDHPELFELYPEARQIKVTSARLVGNASYGRNEIKVNKNASPENALSSILHEVQHWIQEKEGFARGGNKSHFINQSINLLNKLDEKLELIDKNLGNEQKFSVRELIELENERSKIVSQIEEIRGDDGRDYEYKAWDDYQNTAGEYEARDVQARQSMTPEQRRAVAPYSSENIAEEDAIVMFGGGGVQASMNSPEESPKKDTENTRNSAEKGDIKITYDSAGTGRIHGNIWSPQHARGNSEGAAGSRRTMRPQGLEQRISRASRPIDQVGRRKSSEQRLGQDLGQRKAELAELPYFIPQVPGLAEGTFQTAGKFGEFQRSSTSPVISVDPDVNYLKPSDLLHAADVVNRINPYPVLELIGVSKDTKAALPDGARIHFQIPVYVKDSISNPKDFQEIVEKDLRDRLGAVETEDPGVFYLPSENAFIYDLNEDSVIITKDGDVVYLFPTIREFDADFDTKSKMNTDVTSALVHLDPELGPISPLHSDINPVRRAVKADTHARVINDDERKMAQPITDVDSGKEKLRQYLSDRLVRRSGEIDVDSVTANDDTKNIMGIPAWVDDIVTHWMKKRNRSTITWQQAYDGLLQATNELEFGLNAEGLTLVSSAKMIERSEGVLNRMILGWEPTFWSLPRNAQESVNTIPATNADRIVHFPNALAMSDYLIKLIDDGGETAETPRIVSKTLSMLRYALGVAEFVGDAHADGIRARINVLESWRPRMAEEESKPEPDEEEDPTPEEEEEPTPDEEEDEPTPEPEDDTVDGPPPVPPGPEVEPQLRKDKYAKGSWTARLNRAVKKKYGEGTWPERFNRAVEKKYGKGTWEQRLNRAVEKKYGKGTWEERFVNMAVEEKYGKGTWEERFNQAVEKKYGEGPWTARLERAVQEKYGTQEVSGELKRKAYDEAFPDAGVGEYWDNERIGELERKAYDEAFPDAGVGKYWDNERIGELERKAYDEAFPDAAVGEYWDNTRIGKLKRKAYDEAFPDAGVGEYWDNTRIGKLERKASLSEEEESAINRASVVVDEVNAIDRATIKRREKWLNKLIGTIAQSKADAKRKALVDELTELSKSFPKTKTRAEIIALTEAKYGPFSWNDRFNRAVDEKYDSALIQLEKDVVKGFFTHISRTIGLMRLADGSRVLREMALSARQAIRGTDLGNELNAAYGIDGDNWTKAEEDRFARHFGRYAHTGQAPAGASAGLKTAFAEIKKIVRGIYETLTGSPIAEEIPPKVRELLDRIVLASDKKPAKGDGIKYSKAKGRNGVTEAMDREYLAAVEAGDMDKAQAMVDEAVKVAGLVALSQSKDSVPTGYYRHTLHRLNSLRRTEDATRLKDRGEWDEFLESLDGANPANIEPIVTVEYEGEEGIFYVKDGNHRVTAWQDELNIPGDTQIPSLTWVSDKDPVTYDSTGKVIPLSQRFNDASDDIRYSTGEAMLAGDQVYVSDQLSKQEQRFKEEHEFFHWAKKNEPRFEKLMDVAWNSLDKGDQKEIDDMVNDLYRDDSDDDKREEREVRALELIRRRAEKSPAWKRFVTAVKVLWAKHTGREPRDPEALAARMVAVARAELAKKGMKTKVVSPAQMKEIAQSGDVRYSSKGVEKTKNKGILSDGKSGNGEPEDTNVQRAVEGASGVSGGADTSERGLTQAERLDVWEADEKAIGIFVRSAGLDSSWKAPVGSTRPTGGGGGEHDVWVSGDRVFKATKGDHYGQVPQISTTSGEGWENEYPRPRIYLERVRLMGEVFGVHSKLEGIIKTQYGISIVTSQPMVFAKNKAKAHPTKPEIKAFMEGLGFQSIGYGAFYRPSDRTLVADAKEDNFIAAKNGIVPIDLMIVRVDDAFHDKLMKTHSLKSDDVKWSKSPSTDVKRQALAKAMQSDKPEVRARAERELRRMDSMAQLNQRWVEVVTRMKKDGILKVVCP